MKLKQMVQDLIHNAEPLLAIQLKYADRLDLRDVSIPKFRAEEIIKQLRSLQKQLPKGL